VVADTNVFVSAVIFGGLPGTFLDVALADAFTLVTSALLLEELSDTLSQKFQVSAADTEAIRAKLESCALVVEPDLTVNAIVDDPDDNRVLECAVSGQADCAGGAQERFKERRMPPARHPGAG
jgi:putative PIN family toxin of toxin-antitoxin system